MDLDLRSVLDGQRRQRGFMTSQELLALGENGNLVLDPYSVLLAARLSIGSGNVFYPNVIIEASEPAEVAVGNNNTFTPGCLLIAAGGEMRIGDHNLFGDGGFTARTEPGERLEIGDYGRYINGPALSGSNTLGSGSQIIGPIRVQGCDLGAGEAYTHPRADERGAVLKGYGLARSIRLTTGRVINGRGDFRTSDSERQSFYHPRTEAGT